MTDSQPEARETGSLKPCPFCAAPVGVDRRRRIALADGIGPRWHWTCGACGATGPLHRDINDAEAAWSERPAEDALRARIAALEASRAELLPLLDLWDGDPDDADALAAAVSEQQRLSAGTVAMRVEDLKATAERIAALEARCGECEGELADLRAKERATGGFFTVCQVCGIQACMNPHRWPTT